MPSGMASQQHASPAVEQAPLDLEQSLPTAQGSNQQTQQAAGLGGSGTPEEQARRDASHVRNRVLPHLGPVLAGRIVENRPSEGFVAVDEVLAVKGVRDDLLGTAARDVRDQFIALQEKEQ